jgi:hypothetical protein
MRCFNQIRIVICCLLLKVTGLQASGAQKSLALQEPARDQTIASARVISCAIRFPIDSVRFSEVQIKKCMQAVNIKSVSYVHIIATASSSGSGTHNLYLSSRRAGGLEAYFNNHYPDLKVHAFGGGENPRFGMMARIFIVENNAKPDSLAPGVQLASIGPPEIIERTVTKIVKTTEYKPRPSKEIRMDVLSGTALSNQSKQTYDYLAIKLTRTVTMPYISHFLGKLTVGLEHRLLQSNQMVDMHLSNVLLGRRFQLPKLYGKQLTFEQTIEAGQLLSNTRTIDWGTTSSFGIQYHNYQVSLVATKSNYLATFGLGLGLKM